MSEFRNNDNQENINQPADKPDASQITRVEKLVMGAINGQADAFGELYIVFVEKIYRYVFYHVNSKTFAEDITEEVFLKAWRAIKSCRGKESTFSSWLYRIAHNQMVDEIRKRQRRPAVELENVENISDNSEGVEKNREQLELAGVIDRLPPNQRQVIILKFIEGLDNPEISRIMGKSEGAIRVLQMRGLSRLREELEKE
ncbi:MAG: sigma-70 family RNA polymerase sigma factor [Dehalococcoidales bacterium]